MIKLSLHTPVSISGERFVICMIESWGRGQLSGVRKFTARSENGSKEVKFVQWQDGEIGTIRRVK